MRRAHDFHDTCISIQPNTFAQYATRKNYDIPYSSLPASKNWVRRISLLRKIPSPCTTTRVALCDSNETLQQQRFSSIATDKMGFYILLEFWSPSKAPCIKGYNGRAVEPGWHAFIRFYETLRSHHRDGTIVSPGDGILILKARHLSCT